MNAKVPIYIADVVVKITEKKGKISTQSRYVILRDQIVKGFTLKDIARRKQNIADKFVNNSATEKARITGLHLISQHGYGVDEKI